MASKGDVIAAQDLADRIATMLTKIIRTTEAQSRQVTIFTVRDSRSTAERDRSRF